jgi:hypothetical protein
MTPCTRRTFGAGREAHGSAELVRLADWSDSAYPDRCRFREPGRLLVVALPPKTAVHPDPVWRDRSNFTIRADLTPYGMPGSFEQMWTRTDDQREYEVCCIPFFTYGIALGDVVTWDPISHLVEVATPSGRQNIRIAFLDKSKAAASHTSVLGALVSAGCLIEFSSDGYGAIDIETADRSNAVVALLAPLVEDQTLIWEWGAQ